jgi:ActR/RegA family two-component response regulator
LARANDSVFMEQAATPETQGSERRRAARVRVAGVAVLQSGTQPPSVWRISDLSVGGAGLVGDGAMIVGKQSLCLHVAGFPALQIEAKVLRRQLVARRGRCAVRFVDATEEQREVLRAMMAADHAPVIVPRRALVVSANEKRARSLSSQLTRLGFSVRQEPVPGQAVAWLQREDVEAVLVDEAVVDGDRWNLLQFVRDTAPEVRRLVIANDVRGFRLYFAIKAGLVDGLVEPAMSGDALARQVTGAPAPASDRRARATRGLRGRAR